MLRPITGPQKGLFSSDWCAFVCAQVCMHRLFTAFSSQMAVNPLFPPPTMTKSLQLRPKASRTILGNRQHPSPWRQHGAGEVGGWVGELLSFRAFNNHAEGLGYVSLHGTHNNPSPQNHKQEKKTKKQAKPECCLKFED